MKSLFFIFFLLFPSMICFADDMPKGQAIQNQPLTNKNQPNNQTNIANSQPTSSRLQLNPNAAPVTSGRVTLSGLSLNNSGTSITVSPNKVIRAIVDFTYNCPQCKPDSINLILIGIDGADAQACVYFGGMMGKESNKFNLSAPSNPGTYQIRFRYVYAQAYNCEDAVKHWWGINGTPTQEATIGTIVVK